MQRVFSEVRSVILEISAEDLRSKVISPEDSLLDLGMDSLLVVELAVELEQRLGVGAFPLEEWRDREAQLEGTKFTVGSLVAAFASLMPQEEQHEQCA